MAIDGTLSRWLQTLRWWAAAGYAISVAVLIRLDLAPEAYVPLMAASLGAFALNLLLRLATDAIGALAQLLIDIALLAWAIAWSGGAMNPFVSLLLVPIALAALALPPRDVLIVALAAGLAYALAAWLALPLPHVHGVATLFDWHLVGMAVNFGLTALIFVAVLARLAQQRQTQQLELARLREQQVRAEGIFGIAAQAAATAHALNTPLGTLTLALEDLREDVPEALAADVERAQTVVEHCREQVRQLVRDANPAERPPIPLAALVAQAIERWRLLRPSVEMVCEFELRDVLVRNDPSLAHLLQALLDNAADAGDNRVRMSLRTDDRWLIGEIVNNGHLRTKGFFVSDKPSGLGVGLAISHATVERYDGSLKVASELGLTVARFRLSMLALRA